MSTFNDSYTRNGQAITITVTLKTGTGKGTSGMQNTSTITGTINGGTPASVSGILDQDLVKTTFDFQAMVNEQADGIYDPAINKAFTDAGYTYTP